jgi:hypothetical protein
MPSITALPSPPSTLDPENFASEMDDFLAALPTFVDELNSFASTAVLAVSATSTSSVVLGTGLKTFTVQTGKGFLPGMDLVAAYTVTPTIRMLAVVYTYNSATGELVLDVYDEVGAAGTYADWTFSITAAVDTTNFVTPDGTQTLSNKTLASPVFTGTPVAPTAAANTNTTQVATTAYVQGELADMATLASPTFTGTPAAPTAAAATNTTQIATTAFVQQELGSKANLASPAFTGTPTAPTAAGGTNTTQIATTAFVKSAIDTLVAAAPGVLDTLDELAAALGDDANFAATMTAALAAKAALASPTFTGTPAAPTAAARTNTTQLATTAFVQQEIVSGKKTFTADGAITAGEVVVLTAAGAVAPVASSLGADTLGSEQVHLSAATLYYGCINIPGTSKWVLLYTGFLVVAELDTLTGTVTFGTPVAFSFATTAKMAWHTADNCLAIAYINTTVYVQAATISGTTITLGTAVSGASVSGAAVSICYQAHQAKCVVAYEATTSSMAIRSVHIASTVVTFHTALTLVSGLTSTTEIGAIAEIPGTPYVLATYQGSSSYSIKACEVNGATTTAGSAATLTALPTKMQYDAMTGKVVAFRGNGQYQIITPSTTSTAAPTVGTAQTLSGFSIVDQAVTYDSDSGRLVIFGRESTTNYGIVVSATVGVSTLSTSSVTYVNTSTTDTLFCDYSSTADSSLLIYQDEGNLDYGTVRAWDSGDIVTDADDWIGIAAEAISNGATGTITLRGGVSTNQTGLTPNTLYYIEDDGDLTTVANGRLAGLALSSTSILLNGAFQ